MAVVPRPRIRRLGIVLLLVLVLAGAGAVALLSNGSLHALAFTARTRLSGVPAIEGLRLTAFPPVPTAGLPAQRVRIVEQTRRQFDVQHPGAFYSDGVTEPWCADFVSWVLNTAGAPLTNPNSGSWRIPGVATLAEYFQAAGRFQPPAGYAPRPGDVALYADPSPFGQHTNIVLGFDAGLLTTIGGNEHGGISIHRFALADDPGVVGFGRPVEGG